VTRLALIPLLFACAVPAYAQQMSDADCDQMGVILQEVADLRKTGAEAEAVILQIQGDLDGDAAEFAPVVPDLVTFIYAQPEDGLTDDLGARNAAACKGG